MSAEARPPRDPRDASLAAGRADVEGSRDAEVSRDDAARGAGVDTIVAASSAAGAGERAVVRLSGPRAFDVARALVLARDPLVPGRDARATFPLADGAPVPCALLCWRAPRSATGDDVVELQLPGWPVLVTEVLRRAMQAGARPAGRGEFTRRALLAGKLSLVQALAVGRLADARDRDEVASAALVLTGSVDALHGRLRDALLDVLALVEAHVDFEEEDTEAVSSEALLAGLAGARALVDELLRAGAAAAPTDGELDVALLGPPNAGKSRLFGALCPGAHAAVSPVPGTTRDVLEARAVWWGRAVRVLDGPGYDSRPSDLLDGLAMERHLRRLPPHAVVLLVAEAVPDGSPPRERDERALAACAAAAAGRPLLRVDAQIDRSPGLAAGARAEHDPSLVARIAVSAQEGLGLDALRAAILAAAPASVARDLGACVQAEAARRVRPLLEEASQLDLPAALPLLALLLREALERMQLDPDAPAHDLDDALLDRIFSSFCIGK